MYAATEMWTEVRRRVLTDELSKRAACREYGLDWRTLAKMLSHIEVAEDTSLDARGQIAQVLTQIDATLETIRSDRSRLLQVLVFVAEEADGAILDELWDTWVPAGHPPVRAMVQVGLGKSCKVEMVVMAAVAGV